LSSGLVSMLINAFLRRKYPYIPPPPHSAAVSSEQPSDNLNDFDYPITLAARAFNSTEVMNLPRVSLQETELSKYQNHPELLQRETFVSFNEDEAEYEAFRIPMFITAGQERIFYVVYADGGPEAVALTSIHLFDLLRTSELVTNCN
jgi:hypothetical protein